MYQRQRSWFPVGKKGTMNLKHFRSSAGGESCPRFPSTAPSHPSSFVVVTVVKSRLVPDSGKCTEAKWLGKIIGKSLIASEATQGASNKQS